ncbi:MAG TPA: hypothetical protein VGR48_12575 [Terriglobales bacterium]|nr:hypothetical protein [Terriglobales bacterium]
MDTEPSSRRVGWRQLDSASAATVNVVNAETGSTRWKFTSESLKQLFQLGTNTIWLQLARPSTQPFHPAGADAF